MNKTKHYQEAYKLKKIFGIDLAIKHVELMLNELMLNVMPPFDPLYDYWIAVKDELISMKTRDKFGIRKISSQNYSEDGIGLTSKEIDKLI